MFFHNCGMLWTTPKQRTSKIEIQYAMDTAHTGVRHAVRCLSTTNEHISEAKYCVVENPLWKLCNKHRTLRTNRSKLRPTLDHSLPWAVRLFHAVHSWNHSSRVKHRMSTPRVTIREKSLHWREAYPHHYYHPRCSLNALLRCYSGSISS